MDYPAGYFCELIAEHNWPPSFRSQIRVDRKSGRFETSYGESMRLRAAGGWDRHVIVQPGSVPYIQAGPVQMMERAK